MSESAQRDLRTPLRRYDSYHACRDSGLEWLGEIPAHWELRRLKTIASVQLSNVDKKSVDDQEPVNLCNYTDVYYHEQITKDLEFMAATATEDQIRRFSLRRGDVLITKDSETPDDIAVPALVVEDLPGVLCGYHLAQIRSDPSQVEGRYLARAFAAVGLRDQFHVAANGITRYGLTGDAIASSVFCLPPLDEQRAIAGFLDRETRKIDELVAKKKRLIKLLQEKRTSLVSEAATRGLDPSVPLMDSGLEWLGEIPAHWELRRLKTIASVQLSNVDKKSVDDQEPVNLCNYTDVYYHEQITKDLEFMAATATEDQIRRFSLRRGDVLITKDSETPDDIAVPALVVEDLPGVLCGYHLAQIRSDPSQVEGRYLARAFAAVGLRDQFHVAANGITRYGLTGDAIASSVFCLPPLDEQRAIAGFLDRETRKIDELVAKIESGIERLGEYRTTLIFVAVTGRIDVGGEVS